MPAAYFLITFVFLIVAVNTVRPPVTHLPAAVRPSWMLGMLGSELLPLWSIGLVVVTSLAVAGSVGESVIGRAGLVVAAATLGIDVVILRRSSLARRAMASALAGTVDVPRTRLDVAAVVIPNPYPVPSDIERLDDIEYAEGYELDLYRPTDDSRSATGAPVLVQIHGGSWRGGDRRQQGRPLTHAMARRGWTVASVDYPLVPEATLPEPVIGLHEAVAWIRANADELGIDRRRIFVTGGSAGGHLAAMVALTDGHPRWSQRSTNDPGIAGAVTLYGVYDLLDRAGIRDAWPVVADELVKADRDREPEKFVAGSPIDHISPDAPAFLVLHGTHDPLVPIAESRRFVEALREVTRQPCVFVPVPGASHSFDALPSLRTQRVVDGIAAFLEAVAAVVSEERSI